MNALLLLLAIAGMDHAGTLVSQEGGDPIEVTAQDAPDRAKDGLSLKTPVSLRSEIQRYREQGGREYYVRGKTDAQHLVEDHGWTYKQISGLTREELMFLHGATHTGSLKPEQFAVDSLPSPCVLKFTASWCGLCRTEKVSAWLTSSGWTVVPVDIDNQRDIQRRFNVTRVPTFVVIRNGKEVARYTGTSKNAFLPKLRAATRD